MTFIVNNWLLILVALSSGSLLFWPMLRDAQSGSLTPAGAVQLINRERAVVIDIRTPDEYAAGHVTGARNLPLDQLEARLAGTVKKKTLPLVLVCESGARSNKATGIAKQLGYEQAQALAGGLKAWRAANLPVERS
ncbi:MAG: rhodanese-like domain-containing protein [Variovorax sp.]